jgi:hypothetical protein
MAPRRKDYGSGTMRQLAARRWQLRIYTGTTASGSVRHINRTFEGTETQARKELARSGPKCSEVPSTSQGV